MKQHLLKFPVDRWNTLYSLEQAISLGSREGDHLIVLKGKTTLEQSSFEIELELRRHHERPVYATTPNGRTVLGKFSASAQNGTWRLQGRLPVPGDVFAELMKNLVEYSGIEGIQIQATLGFEAADLTGCETPDGDITRLDYSMRSQLSV